MINVSKRLRIHGAVWGTSLVLAGCFGGGSDPVVPMTPVSISPLVAVPATATASIQALLQYQAAVNSSAQAEQDKAEPIDISSLMLPVSETAEPFEV